MTRGTIWSRPCSAKGGVSMSGSCWSARPDPRRVGVLPVDAVQVEAAGAQVLDRAALADVQEVVAVHIGYCQRTVMRGCVGCAERGSVVGGQGVSGILATVYCLASHTKKQ